MGDALRRELRFLEQDSGFSFNNSNSAAKTHDVDDAVSVDSCVGGGGPDTSARPLSTPRLKSGAEQKQRYASVSASAAGGAAGVTTPRQSVQTPSGRRTPAANRPAMMPASARAASPSQRRPHTTARQRRTGSATFNANNMSNIYNNSGAGGARGGGGGEAKNKPHYPGSKINRALRKSARSHSSRMREKQTIYSNLSTSRFFAQT